MEKLVKCSKREERMKKRKYLEILAVKLLELVKSMIPEVQEQEFIPSQVNKNRFTPKHISVKLRTQKTKMRY